MFCGTVVLLNGTITTTLVSPFIVIPVVTVTPFTVTAVTESKSLPTILTIVPVTPVNGVNDVMDGGKQTTGGGDVVF